MNIEQIIQRRYGTKSFNPKQKISHEDFAQIRAALRNSPSSVNVQPWHFIIADDEAGKARVAKATEAFPLNTPKITNASHVVVFASRIHADDAFLASVLEQEDKDGRYATPEARRAGDDARRTFLDIYRNTVKNEEQWLAHQVYINLGFTLMAAAALGIDAAPMAGVDLKVLDAEFDLPRKGYRAVIVVSFGYHADDDFNAALPKSRLEENVIFSRA